MTKRQVIRKCLVCGNHKDKKELIRIVKDPDRGIIVDPTGKKNGRGAYICRDIKCIEGAIKSKRINAALKAMPTDNFYEELKGHVTE